MKNNVAVKFNYLPKHCKYYSLVVAGNVMELYVFDSIEDMIVNTLQCVDEKTDFLVKTLNGMQDRFSLGLNDILIRDKKYCIAVGYKDMRTTPKPSIFTLGVGMTCLTSQ